MVSFEVPSGLIDVTQYSFVGPSDRIIGLNILPEIKTQEQFTEMALKQVAIVGQLSNAKLGELRPPRSTPSEFIARQWACVFTDKMPQGKTKQSYLETALVLVRGQFGVLLFVKTDQLELRDPSLLDSLIDSLKLEPEPARQTVVDTRTDTPSEFQCGVVRITIPGGYADFSIYTYRHPDGTDQIIVNRDKIVQVKNSEPFRLMALFGSSPLGLVRQTVTDGRPTKYLEPPNWDNIESVRNEVEAALKGGPAVGRQLLTDRLSKQMHAMTQSTDDAKTGTAKLSVTYQSIKKENSGLKSEVDRIRESIK